MDTNSLDYERIADAIEFISFNLSSQPSLEEVASYVHMSPFHFQRTFKEWAGVTPKHFLEYLNVEYAKRTLQKTHSSLFEASLETGLSSPSRLYDIFVKIEGMTPGEYKNGGENLTIKYSFEPSPFGEVFIASTEKGICSMGFPSSRKAALDGLKETFPNARLVDSFDEKQRSALSIFREDWDHPKEIKLHLKGSEFQIKVWSALLQIPMGGLATYGEIAAKIDEPEASRAVGNAVGSNPVAYIIPCHRVIRATGEFGNYHWGAARKMAMIGWEAGAAERVEEVLKI